MLRAVSRRDRGSGPVTALMAMAILALVFTIGLTALFAGASDERSTAQHAADAAALAGARGVLDDTPSALAPGFTTPPEIPLLLGGSVCVQTGRVDAFRLARANGATLTSYCYNVWTDKVNASVRLNESRVADTKAAAVAEAATTFEPASCVLDPDFTPPDDPAPPNDPAPPKDPVPTSLSTSVDCGSGPLTVVLRTPPGRFFFVGLAAELADREPRLVS